MIRWLGWWLLLAALAWGAWADAAHLLSPNPAQAVSAARLHAWLVALGFSHLLLAWAPLPAPTRWKTTVFTGVGTLLCLVSLLLPVPTASLVLRVVGALLNLIGSLLASRRLTVDEPFGQRLRLLAIGFLIDLGVFGIVLFVPEAGNTVADLSLRMALLARMAAVALPLLATLAEEAGEDTSPSRPAAWLDTSAFVMTMLLLASGGSPWLKYLLPLPAVGAAIGLWQATLRRRVGVGWAKWFWLVATVSVTAGLAIGLFAFNGPVTSPSGMEDYAGLARRLCRHSHIALLVTGITGLALTRAGVCDRASHLVFPLLLAGGLLTAALPFLPNALPLYLVLGPMLQVSALGMGIWLLARRNPKEPLSVRSSNAPPFGET